MSCLSQFFILTQRGNPLIRKEFRGDLPPTTTDTFYRNVKFFNGQHQHAPPIFLNDGITYFYTQTNGLYFVATTKQSISPSLTMEVLTKITTVFADYIGILTEETIKQNFILLYELLDEVLDFGYAQSISTELLKEFVFNEPPQSKKKIKLPKPQPKTQSANSAHRPVWHGGQRKSKTDKNEIFVDVSERVSVTFNNKGNHISNAIDGTIKIKSFLTSNPQLSMALNDNLFVNDINFNEIVNLEQYERDKLLSFVPGDGEFNLLNYRITNDFEPPFKMFSYFQLISPYKFELVLKITSGSLSKRYCGRNVCVEIPILMECQTVTTELGRGVSGQNVIVNRKDRKVIWKMDRFVGESEQLLKIRITFEEQKTFAIKKQIGAISMGFEIPGYNVSNLQIKYLRVMEAMAKYKVYKWVRYNTQSESYICRL